MHFRQVKRRDFITLLSGAAAAWPVAAGAQQAARTRRVGILMPLTADDPEDQAGHAAFLQGLQETGWSVGRNLAIDTRWGGDADRIRRSAIELVALAPDVIFTVGANATAELQRATRAVPIVFSAVTDPVGGGLVESLARPGGNATGFAFPEYSIAAKWLELLKEIAPRVTRVAVFRDTMSTGVGMFAAVQAAAPSFGVDTNPLSVRDAAEIEHGIEAFARSSSGGLIVPPSPMTVVHRGLIISLAARHQIPAVYPFRRFTTTGGLISYGPDLIDLCRRAAGYADRILKGEKPSDLPVQAPTKFELTINLKTAKALGLTFPLTLLGRADEVIE